MKNTSRETIRAKRPLASNIAVIALGVTILLISACVTNGAGVNAIDHEYAWDMFFQGNKELTRCRGIQTKRLVDDTLCAGRPVNDYQWPGPWINVD